MSSNGSIPPNMNPAPSGASAYESEQTGVHHSLHHCYIWLGALRAVPIIFICGLSSLSGLMKLAEALGFVSVDAFFRCGTFAPGRHGACLRSCDGCPCMDVPLHLVRI